MRAHDSKAECYLEHGRYDGAVPSGRTPTTMSEFRFILKCRNTVGGSVEMCGWAQDESARLSSIGSIPLRTFALVGKRIFHKFPKLVTVSSNLTESVYGKI